MVNSKTSYNDRIHLILESIELRPFFNIQTWKGIFSVIQEWVLILIAAFLCETYYHWSIYIITVVFIGARYLALGLLMHESVHGLISKNKKVNDIVGEVFCAWPVIVSMKSYKVKHLKHHQCLNTDEDPDYTAKTDKNWQFPMPISRFLKIVVKQLSGFGVFETFRVMSGKSVASRKPKSSRRYKIARVSFYIIVLGGFIYFDHEMLLLKYWLVPFISWTQLINRWRRIAEHSGIEHQPLEMQTRTTKHNFISRLLLSPKNISYHCEHHMFPSIP
ncbi:MAG TPA: hypothetical protein DCR47_01540, partial [Cryomorphaceae bacterium]|nr:hypothetical protein [Cryomorphaceae bacterium]